VVLKVGENYTCSVTNNGTTGNTTGTTGNTTGTPGYFPEPEPKVIVPNKPDDKLTFWYKILYNVNIELLEADIGGGNNIRYVDTLLHFS
jgi:hypothetical protein